MSTRHSPVSTGRLALVGDWQLTPEGGVLHRGERTAVIADVHLGYEWARGAAGDCIPAHCLAEMLAKLDSMLQRGSVERLVVAGDLVESRRPCSRTAGDLARLVRWLQAREVRLVPLRGNHDRSLGSMTGEKVAAGDGCAEVFPNLLEVGGWTVAHGHLPTPARRLITGHHHPVLRVAAHPAPCFLVGANRIILPAFSANAAGLDVSRARWPSSWRRHHLRCLVSTGTELLDFGPLETLSARLD